MSPLKSTAFVFVASMLGLFAGSCSSVPDAEDVYAWRKQAVRAGSGLERISLEEEIAKVDALREARDLGASRTLALTLAAEQSQNAEVLFRASRAETDAVLFLHPAQPIADGEEDPTEQDRIFAAVSALDFARRGAAIAASNAAILGQLAWSLGATTHLLPMLERGDRAHETIDAIDRTLKLDPEQEVALATLAVLHTRLATLPWIAKAMASAPTGELDEAIKIARKLVARRSSVEHHLLLAKALIAAEKTEEAKTTLDAALAAEPAHPRDGVLRPQAVALRESLNVEE